MKQLLLFLKSHKYQFIIFGILLFSAVFRFYNFADKWGLAGDGARDAMIGKEALMRHELPLYGSFSSAGPFVFGPLFYWFIMGSFLLLPFTFASPWLLIGVISVAVVGAFIYLGFLLGGKKLSIILGILSATSAHLIVRSVILGQHTFISLFTVCLMICFVLLWQKKKSFFAIMMGISLGIALSMHYQAINLFIFFPAILIVPTKKFWMRFVYLCLMIVGFLIPSLPLLWWDAHQNFANIRNILDYFLIGQYRLYVPNSWKLYVLHFLPSYWLFVVGGNIFLGVFAMLFTSVTSSYLLLRRKLRLEIIVFAGILVCLLFLQRYYHGERSEGYLLYLDPFIILLTGVAINTFFENTAKKILHKSLVVVGSLLVMIVTIGNLLYAWQLVNVTNNIDVMERALTKIEKQYPNKAFALYDYKWETGETSMMLSALMEIHNVSNLKGQPIGFFGPKAKLSKKRVILGKFESYSIISLTTQDTKDSKSWVPMNHEAVYDDLMQWMKGRKLTATFSLSSYIVNKLHRGR